MLLVIAGIILCVLGAVVLCAGGFGSTMLGNLNQVSKLAPPSADNAELEEITKAIHQVEPLIRPAILTVAASTLVWSAILIWMGVATIQGRRWARKLLLATGWAWCGNVILQFVAFLGSLPTILSLNQSLLAASPGGSPPGALGATAFGMIVQVIINLITHAIAAAPGVALIILFGLRNVRLSCDQLDPKPNWTDRVPIQVLPLWLTLLGVTSQVLFFVPLIPAAVQLLPALHLNSDYLVAGGLCLAALPALAAWLIAKMHPGGWWLVMVGSVAVVALLCAFHLTTDFAALFRKLISMIPARSDRNQIKPEMIDSIARVVRDYWIAIAVTGAAFLGYIYWIKRFFDPQTKDAGQAAAH